MNERIKELLTQAISDVDYIHFDKAIDEELAQMYIPDCFAERFAELIVEECARDFDKTYMMGGETMGMYIRRKFGVAEWSTSDPKEHQPDRAWTCIPGVTDTVGAVCCEWATGSSAYAGA